MHDPLPDIVSRSLTSPLSLVCMVIALVSAAVVLLLVRACVRLGRRRVGRRLLTDRGGTATIEFALMLPLLMYMLLLLAQSMLLTGGNIFVHYAAFAAARSAIVQIPSETEDDGANALTHAAGFDKYDSIHRAAAYALVPVAGRADSADTTQLGDAFVLGLQQLHREQELTEPNWIESFAARRLAYAMEQTQVQVLLTSVETKGGERRVVLEELIDGESHTFGAKDPITVRVRHLFNLPVPYANLIFADGQIDNSPSRYTRISAASTLTNEGTLDWLPPAPEIERVP